MYCSEDSPCIIRAVRQKQPDIARIQRIVQAGVNVNEADHLGRTAINWAVGLGHLPIIRILLENGADISIKDGYHKTPLHYVNAYNVTDTNHRQVVYEIYKLLLEKGANCNEPDDNEVTPFYHALTDHDSQVIKLLLKHGADVKRVTSYGGTAIHYAARNPHLDVIGLIFDQGFDIESSTTTNYSPLLIAAKFKNFEACEYFLKRGALVNKRAKDGNTPLIAAISHIDKDREVELEKTIEILLEYGADATVVAKGETALKLTRYYGETIKKLLIRHMAKMQRMNLAINAMDERMINFRSLYKEYYQMCLKELENMKKTKFYDEVTIFSIFSESRKVIAKYVKNSELVNAFEDKIYAWKYPIYIVSLKNRFYAELKKLRTRDNAAEVLSNIFKFYDTSHPINRKILSYLREEDLQFLSTT